MRAMSLRVSWRREISRVIEFFTVVVASSNDLTVITNTLTPLASDRNEAKMIIVIDSGKKKKRALLVASEVDTLTGSFPFSRWSRQSTVTETLRFRPDSYNR